ncbi:hypothetical protein CPC08DRAFT_303484 [Agrocybe pediades]|nr:hypothetical protein CPC08DRAFT_303484 [Agrocybe pediades]
MGRTNGRYYRRSPTSRSSSLKLRSHASAGPPFREDRCGVLYGRQRGYFSSETQIWDWPEDQYGRMSFGRRTNALRRKTRPRSNHSSTTHPSYLWPSFSHHCPLSSVVRLLHPGQDSRRFSRFRVGEYLSSKVFSPLLVLDISWTFPYPSCGTEEAIVRCETFAVGQRGLRKGRRLRYECGRCPRNVKIGLFQVQNTPTIFNILTTNAKTKYRRTRERRFNLQGPTCPK